MNCSNTKHEFVKYLVILLLILIVYGPSINSPYFLDDSHTIATNSSIQSFDNAFKLWSSPRYYSALPSNSSYRPLVTFSNMILWNLGDGATWPFHIWKMILFFALILTLLKVWAQILPKVGGDIVFLMGCCFAVNPVHSQVVIYLTALTTLYTGLFTAISIWFFLKYVDSKKYRDIFFSCCFTFLSMLSKEIGFLPLLIIPLLHYGLTLTGKNKTFSNLKTIGVYCIPVFLGGLLLVLNHESKADSVRGDSSSFTYFITQWRAYIRYFTSFFYSYDLNMDNHSFGFSKELTEPKVIISLILNLILITSAFIFRKKYSLFFIGVFWFYIALIPSSSVWVLAEPVNDHRAFISYFGLSLLFIIGLQFIKTSCKRLLWPIAIMIITIYSFTTFQRAQTWSTNLSLLKDNVKKNPTSGRAYNNLAVKQMSLGSYLEAKKNLQSCLKYSPNYSTCHINIAVTYAAIGEDTKSTEFFEKAIPFDRGKIRSRFFYARFLKNRGFIDKPLKLLEVANNYASGLNLEILMSLIELHVSAGRLSKAKNLWLKGQAHFRSNPNYISLGKQFRTKPF